MGECVYVPFAVYTAWHGYAWSSVPEGVSREELDDLYRRIGENRPDFMGPDDYFEGVSYDNGLLAAFRMKSVPKWDAVGRDADYCAFAFMGLDDAQDFDFDILLGQKEFAEPSHTPGDGFVYNGPTSAPYSIPAAMELYDQHESAQADFHTIGDMLVRCGAHCKSWIFGRIRFKGEQTVFAKTGEWAGEPEEWAAARSALRSKKKASFQKISMKDLEQILGGDE